MPAHSIIFIFQLPYHYAILQQQNYAHSDSTARGAIVPESTSAATEQPSASADRVSIPPLEEPLHQGARTWAVQVLSAQADTLQR